MSLRQSLSFREKTVWVTLFSMVVVYSWYFGSEALQPDNGRLSLAIVALTISQVVPLIVLAALDPDQAREREDEREKLFELKGSRVGYALLTLGALVCCVGSSYFGLSGKRLADCLLLCVVIAQLAKLGTQLLCYRRSA